MDAADQTVHTYGEWSLVVDDAVSELLADNDARVALRPNDYYALYLCGYNNYTAANLSSGLKGSMLSPADYPSKQWEFVPTIARNTYYVKNVESGKYISFIEADKRVKAEADDTSDALLISLKESVPGKYAFYNYKESLYMGYASNKDVVGTTGGSFLWTIKRVEDHYTDALIARAEKDVAEADRLLAEVLDPYANCICVSGTIVPLTETFEDDVLTLYGFRGEVKTALYDRDFEALEKLLPQLEAAIDAVKDAYLTRQEMPKPAWITTNGDGTVYYYAIQNLKTRKYCRLDDGTGRYAGNIQTDDLDVDDQRFWFYFEETENDGEYHIKSFQTHCSAAINNSYIDIIGKKEATPFTLTLNADQTGFVIHNGDDYWTTQTSGQMYAQIRKTPTEWRLVYLGDIILQDIRPPYQDSATAPLFDLTGRHVNSPTRGLYIQQGKKVFIK